MENLVLGWKIGSELMVVEESHICGIQQFLMEFSPAITKPCSSREAEKQTADIGLEDQRILQQKIESQIYSRRWHMEFGRQ